MVSKEQRFFEALRDVFVGAKVEGESGFVNLMRIKSQYYEQGVFPCLKEEIDKALGDFPEFREELFDRLYNFFKRYFSESGSIYFRFTPPHEHVYEKVYTDDRDVALFWKTHMLYYVKTDRLFRSMVVEVDGFRFFFDVSILEHKRANEKRSLVYDFKERREDGTLAFTVTYSERGRKTNIADIRRAIKDALGLKKYTAQVPSEKTLERAFRLFERQSEVDYFINKDARKFLREQFNLWLYQYVFEPEERQGTVWTERRIRQLQVLKKIAYKIVDFIAQFEDELVRIWNKPKFVLGSHYVITLDRIAAQEGGTAALERLLAHPGMADQVQEWRDLGMVGEEFTPEQVWVEDLMGKRLHERYRYLPLDTRHFPDLEMVILSLFDHLDRELDGRLVHSENYQALKTMLPKFRERVKCIYIDPPYNTGEDEFVYKDRFRHSSWLSLIQDRLDIARSFFTRDGSIFISIDDNEVHHLELLLRELYDENNFVANIVWQKRTSPDARATIGAAHDYLVVFARSLPEFKGALRYLPLSEERRREYRNPDNDPRGPWASRDITGQVGHATSEQFYEIVTPGGARYYPPKGRCWTISRDTFEKLVADNRIWFGKDGRSRPRLKIFLSEAEGMAPWTWWTNKEVGHNQEATKELNAVLGSGHGYETPKPTRLIKRILELTTQPDPESIILDFFAGSGTTGHAVINLNREDGGRRKYILVEMADYFHTVLLPRIKKVVFSDKWRDGKAQEDGKGTGHFVKYFRLEQYEEVLRKAHYRDDDAPLFFQDPYTQYVFLRDPKMLDNAETGEKVMEVDMEGDEVRVDLSKLYPDIDLAETLSCLTGKWIRRILPAEDDPTKPGMVEFEDGTTVDLQDPPWELVKPLIWW